RGAVGPNFSGPIIDGGHNISSDASGSFTDPFSLNNTDPMLGPLTNNGGSTLTMAPLPGSRAIDGGDSAACPSTDQRGVVRPYGLDCDVGAVEATNAFAWPGVVRFSVSG